MAPLTLVIGNKNYSSWSLRPWLLMKHLDIPFNEVADHARHADHARGHREVQPQRPGTGAAQGELCIWDSLAICEYLAELTGKGWPAGARGARGRALGVRGDALRLHQPALAVAHERPRPQPPHRVDGGAGGRRRAYRRDLERLPRAFRLRRPVAVRGVHASPTRCMPRSCCASTPMARASRRPHAGTWRACSRMPPCRNGCRRPARVLDQSCQRSGLEDPHAASFSPSLTETSCHAIFASPHSAGCSCARCPFGQRRLRPLTRPSRSRIWCA